MHDAIYDVLADAPTAIALLLVGFALRSDVNKIMTRLLELIERLVVSDESRSE